MAMRIAHSRAAVPAGRETPQSSEGLRVGTGGLALPLYPAACELQATQDCDTERSNGRFLWAPGTLKSKAICSPKLHSREGFNPPGQGENAVLQSCHVLSLVHVGYFVPRVSVWQWGGGAVVTQPSLPPSSRGLLVPRASPEPCLPVGR